LCLSNSNGGGWNCGVFGSPKLLPGEESEILATDFTGPCVFKSRWIREPDGTETIDTGGQFSWKDWLWIIMAAGKDWYVLGLATLGITLRISTSTG